MTLDQAPVDADWRQFTNSVSIDPSHCAQLTLSWRIMTLKFGCGDGIGVRCLASQKAI